SVRRRENFSQNFPVFARTRVGHVCERGSFLFRADDVLRSYDASILQRDRFTGLEPPILRVIRHAEGTCSLHIQISRSRPFLKTEAGRGRAMLEWAGFYDEGIRLIDDRLPESVGQLNELQGEGEALRFDARHHVEEGRESGRRYDGQRRAAPQHGKRRNQAHQPEIVIPVKMCDEDGLDARWSEASGDETNLRALAAVKYEQSTLMEKGRSGGVAVAGRHSGRRAQWYDVRAHPASSMDRPRSRRARSEERRV